MVQKTRLGKQLRCVCIALIFSVGLAGAGTVIPAAADEFPTTDELKLMKAFSPPDDKHVNGQWVIIDRDGDTATIKQSSLRYHHRQNMTTKSSTGSMRSQRIRRSNPIKLHVGIFGVR